MWITELTALTTIGIFSSIILIYVTVVFIVSQLLRDNSIMDIAYGPAFAVSYWVTWYLIGQPTGLLLLLGGVITIWALRLSVRIGRKNWGNPEDARYANWRTAWQKEGQLYFVVRSYIQINLLQGIIIFIVSAPLWLSLASTSTTLSVYPIAVWIGISISLFGLLYESIADWQLDSFIAKKKAGTTEKNLMTEGLFYFSRRPNYFGESLVWWGAAITVLSLPFGFIALISPLLITYILKYVTGPMLENIFLEKYPEQYRAYMATTNYMIPGKPRNESHQ